MVAPLRDSQKQRNLPPELNEQVVGVQKKDVIDWREPRSVRQGRYNPRPMPL